MGYVKLRALLIKESGGMSIAATKLGINLNRLYNLTGKYVPDIEQPPYLTSKEKIKIMCTYFKDPKYTPEEVFYYYEDTGKLGTRAVPPAHPRRGY